MEYKKSMTEISNNLDCDKSTYHRYTDTYQFFFEKYRYYDFSLLEIGVESGKSYRLWEEYFSTAKIYGIDIDKEYTTNRGEVFKADQNNLEQVKLSTSSIENCKIIIDDGSHIPEHQLKCFYYLFENLLEDNGIYIIEDIECSYWKPNSEIYGNYTGYLNIVDYFTKFNHSVNSHYNNEENPLNIKMITFAPNCIIIVKGNEDDKVKREYRFRYKL
jgi:hypothetical protein